MRKGRTADIGGLLKEVRRHYRAHKRSHLPWRTTRDPYRILVSEIMLQQTQVKRALPFYAEFTRHFPTAGALARVPLSRVLSHWQGLGYNRRAKYLHEAAKAITKRGSFPRRTEDIEQLPGVGHYTARAVAAFAFNSPEVFIETNIRTAFLYHCYSSVLQNTRIRNRRVRKISDAELLPLVRDALKKSKMPPRDFYAALMDYGSHLKRSGVKLNAKSAHYAKQSKFEGSARQLRGAILKLLLQKPRTAPALASESGRPHSEIITQLVRLQDEGLIVKKNRHYAIA